MGNPTLNKFVDTNNVNDLDKYLKDSNLSLEMADIVEAIKLSKNNKIIEASLNKYLAEQDIKMLPDRLDEITGLLQKLVTIMNDRDTKKEKLDYAEKILSATTLIPAISFSMLAIFNPDDMASIRRRQNLENNVQMRNINQHLLSSRV